MISCDSIVAVPFHAFVQAVLLANNKTQIFPILWGGELRLFSHGFLNSSPGRYAVVPGTLGGYLSFSCCIIGKNIKSFFAANEEALNG